MAVFQTSTLPIAMTTEDPGQPKKLWGAVALVLGVLKLEVIVAIHRSQCVTINGEAKKTTCEELTLLLIHDEEVGIQPSNNKKCKLCANTIAVAQTVLVAAVERWVTLQHN
eukprot:CAMPEP_0175164266 /NCGR_PEP_ID=MMETSP0087-20121206/26305_1 /TAXON_ID=136419 /ORGANISM="Unknown Unknown, Strain D1" /LENGTH=110 /DNA_ID=CAMNT_0016453253 /DNA_START=190 /DNA_END=522 /DNA_ORIENTATION=-